MMDEDVQECIKDMELVIIKWQSKLTFGELVACSNLCLESLSKRIEIKKQKDYMPLVRK